MRRVRHDYVSFEGDDIKLRHSLVRREVQDRLLGGFR